jgi:uncharacterized SAM-binding protein YcdF (DUF218 family)
MQDGLIVGQSDAQHQPSGPEGYKPRGPEKSFLRIFFAMSTIIAIAFFCGFFVFLRSLDRVEPPLITKGDGIVALTGGSDRIADAMVLLARGQGRRLLISGVSNHVTMSKIGTIAPGLENWLKCCVDLGHHAQNTVGNAEETRSWAKTHKYKSIVVVTSNYHMPRALLELQRHMPDIRFIPAPVVTERLHDMAIWKDISLLKTLSHEYTKFVVAYARARLTSPASLAEINSTFVRRGA